MQQCTFSPVLCADAAPITQGCEWLGESCRYGSRMLSLNLQSSEPLQLQIAAGVRQLITQGRWPAGARMPSIRQMARELQVSAYVVVEAYERLVQQGVLRSRPHSGFFVSLPGAPALALVGGDALHPAAADEADAAGGFFAAAVAAGLAGAFDDALAPPGEAALPEAWWQTASLPLADGEPGAGVGDPHPALRDWLVDHLARQELAVRPDQLLPLTSQQAALDLLVGQGVRAGDLVLLDDPAPPAVLDALRQRGAQLLPVPRTAHGYELAALESLLQQVRPRLLFTQPRLHDPTGSVAQLAQLHRLLQLAERHELLIVEWDSQSELDPQQRPTLASLDQLHQVLHIGRVGVSLPDGLRLVFLAGSAERVQRLALAAAMHGSLLPRYTARLLLPLLGSAQRPAHLASLRDQLAQAHRQAVLQLDRQGWECLARPGAGLYLWARHAAVPDALRLARRAQRLGVHLLSGQACSHDARVSGWLRLPVARREGDALWDVLREAGEAPLRGEAPA